MTLEEFSRINGAFHDASQSNGDWLSALNELAIGLRAAGVSVVTLDDAGKVQDVSVGGQMGLDEVHIAAYRTYYGAIDPTPGLVKTLACGEVAQCHQTVSKSFVRQSEYYRDFLIPAGGRFLTGGVITRTVFTATIGVHTGERIGPLQGDALKAFRLILPHITRAYQTRGQLIQKSWGVTAADQATEPMLILDEHAKILYSNSAASVWISKRDNQNTVFLGPWEQDQRSFWAALGRCCTTKAPQRTTLRNCKGAGLNAFFSPVHPPLQAKWVGQARYSRSSLALVRLQPSPANLSAMTMITRFGFTHAEADVAELICSGLKLEAIALQRRVSIATIRAQTRCILGKANVSSMRQFVALAGSRSA